MAVFTVEFKIQLRPGSEGVVEMEVHPEWAPVGVQRFKELVESSFYSQARFHRVIPGFIAQVGIAADPAVYAKWGNNPIKDDPLVRGVSNTRGMVSFAMRGPDTRSCQVFVNFGDNSSLDSQGFSPIAKVTKGMDIIDALQPMPSGPDQMLLKEQGNRYLDAKFSGQLSEIIEARVL